MKAGFWMGPEGSEEDLVLKPIGGGRDPLAPPVPNPMAVLATGAAEELIRRCAGAAVLLPKVRNALAEASQGRGATQFDLSGLGSEDRALIAQVLGDGEVNMVAAMPDGCVAQAQESVLAGLWQVQISEQDGTVARDLLEVGEIPDAALVAAEAAAEDIEIGAPPEGAMNVLPVLAEIRDRVARVDPAHPNHVLNFTLLPMTEADMAFLQRSLGDGPVQMLSRGYGKCRILATGLRHVWSVQYFNAMDSVILDTLEIGTVPASARAAAEDFADSAERLGEILEAYFE